MKRLLISVNIFVFLHCIQCKAQVIDMHLHSYMQPTFNDSVRDYYGSRGSLNADKHFNETYSYLRRYHITKAVVSGSVESVDSWVTKDVDKRFIRGFGMNSPDEYGMDSVKFETLVKAGKIQVFGEIGAYYSGTTLNDAGWQPYLRICEKYDIPVGVHTGGGDPGGTYTWSPKARLKYGDPYLLEDVLVRYPKLRLYIMHSGEDWYEHTLRLMAYYPQLYSDIAAMLWVEPLDQRYVRAFLKNAKQAGYLNRVMYGTDQMRWPYAIKKSIDFLNTMKFLTTQNKRDILYNNAARFLRLKNKP
jgi:predicted TIM-barrel fold metal-dependent hydrolase